MFKLSKIFLATSITTLFVLLSVSNVQAREDYFQPAIGEVLISSVGSEQAMLSEDGSLVVVGADGKILSGWPLSIDNTILVGSPVLADMNGDGVAEVVSFGRDANNVYTVFVYDGNKKLVASLNLGSENVYYDAVALPLKNQMVRDVLVSTQSGKLLQIHLSGSQLSSIVLLNVAKPAVVTANNSGTELIITYPGTKSVDIYGLDGAKITLSKKITVNSEIIFPLTYNSSGAIIYGVSRDNKLVAIDKNSGSVLAGFPSALSSFAVGSPVLVDVDQNSSSEEIVVNLSNGRKDVFDEAGKKLPIDLGIKSFGDQSLDLPNKGDSTLLSGLNYFILRSVSSIKNLVASFWSSVKINLISKIDLLDATISTNPPSGIPPLPVNLVVNASGGAASKVSGRLNFSQLNLRNIVPSYATGSGEAQDNGDTLYLNKMMWKAVNFPYTITSSTVVELDFKSNGLGWSHGFGFDNGYPEWNVKHYIAFSAVYGDSPTADNSFKDYTIFGQWKHYKVPVGKLLTNKAYSEMYFTSYCGNSSCPAVFDSYFRNVRVYESDKPLYNYTWDFGDGAVASSPAFDSVYHTYTTPGDYTAKVTVDDGQTQVIKTIPIKTAWATFDTLISANPENGVPPLPVKLAAIPSGGAALDKPIKIDFNSQTLKNFSSYPNQAGTSTVLDGGDTIELIGFNFKTYDVNYTITSSTVLEFDFKSNVDGWSHGFGFETPWTYGKRNFNLSGYALFDSAINDFRNYTKKGEWKHYKIPVGQYYTVFASRLVFNAYCSNSSCPTNFDSYFRNVRIYESNKSLYSYAWDFGDNISVTSSPGLDSIYHVYQKPGDYIAKVTVSDGETQIVKTIPIKTGWANFFTTISANPVGGVAPLPVRLSSVASGGAALAKPVKVDFNSQVLKNFSSYPTQAGTSTVLDGGDTIGLVGFNFKTYDVNYTLTSSTVLEFDFKSNVDGWSHGLSFETPWTYGKRTFNLSGYALYDSAINDFRDYTKKGEWKHYKIPVGQYYAVFASRLIFNSYCSNSSCPTNFDSYFRNVRIYESDKSLYSYAWDFGDGTSATSSVGYDVIYHAYTTPGDHIVTVTASDGETTAIKTTTVSITP